MTQRRGANNNSGRQQDLRNLTGIEGGSHYRTAKSAPRTARHTHSRAGMGTHGGNVPSSSISNHATRSAHARARKEFATYDTTAIRGKKGPDKRIIAIIAAIVVVIVVAFVVVKVLPHDEHHDLAKSGTSVTITVADGSTTSQIAKSLWDGGLIEYQSVFNKRVKARGVDGQLKAGTYTFVAGVSVDEIIDQLIQGAGLSGDKLTIPEGYTLEQIAALVEQVSSSRITAEAFKQAASDASVYAADYEFLKDAGSNCLEGFLFPQTYGISADKDAEALVREMLDQFKAAFAQVDMSYPTSQGLNTYEFVTLASIVEREGKSDTFGNVASVFFNRLLNDMALQSDATTAYELGYEPGAEEVNTDTPYSTYTNSGLPPTPICNPGLACMQATAVHEDTDYFYFFSVDNDDGTSTYTFSETFDEHDERWANR